jgi:putative ABC transport system substrate-binding protein
MARSALRLLLLVVAALACTHAHADATNPRIGFLSPTTVEGSATILDSLRQGLREQGFVEGRNLTIVSRYANDRFDRLAGLARELVDSRVDVLTTYVTQASIAAKQSTQTIPIVMIGVSDPVATGLVSSLSHPGANVTGTSGAFTGMTAKGVQLLQQLIPGVDRIAVLMNPGNRVFQAQMLAEARASARQLNIELQIFEAGDAASIEIALAAIAKQRLAAVSVLPDPVLSTEWARIATLAAKARLASISVSSGFAEAGGLIAYGPNLTAMSRISASYVARILKGARPADLAIETPTKYELVINLKTAKQIGITVPQALRLRADRLIE